MPWKSRMQVWNMKNIGTWLFAVIHCRLYLWTDHWECAVLSKRDAYFLQIYLLCGQPDRKSSHQLQCQTKTDNLLIVGFLISAAPTAVSEPEDGVNNGKGDPVSRVTVHKQKEVIALTSTSAFCPVKRKPHWTGGLYSRTILIDRNVASLKELVSPNK